MRRATARPLANRVTHVALLAAGSVGAYVLAHSQEPPHHHRVHHHVRTVAQASPLAEATASAAATASATQIPVARGNTITVFASRLDGERLVARKIDVGSVSDRQSIAYLATVQALAGPADTVNVIRFPAGTVARSVHVAGKTADVDLSGAVAKSAPGGYTEAGEFKALVWTLTALPGVSRVRIFIDGKTVSLLPGGHLELDEPLSRSDF